MTPSDDLGPAFEEGADWGHLSGHPLHPDTPDCEGSFDAPNRIFEGYCACPSLTEPGAVCPGRLDHEGRCGVCGCRWFARAQPRRPGR